MPELVSLAPSLLARWLGLAGLLSLAPLGSAFAQSPEAAGLDTAHALEPSLPGEIDETDTQLFAPIPRWEKPSLDTADSSLAVPSFLAPGLDKTAASRERVVRRGLARPELEATAIRRGLANSATGLPAATERAVGMQLGAESVSFSTSVVTATGGWQSSDTRLDWSLARQASKDDDLLWSANAGGNLQPTGSATQSAQASLGYRLRPYDTLVLTTEIAVAGTYTFVATNGLATSLTPRVKAVADLTQSLATPWRTTLDLNLGRQLPLSGSEFQTNASAMLRFQLPAP